MPKGFHVVCLEPGADNPKKHTPPPEPAEGRMEVSLGRAPGRRMVLESGWQMGGVAGGDVYDRDGAK